MVMGRECFQQKLFIFMFPLTQSLPTKKKLQNCFCFHSHPLSGNSPITNSLFFFFLSAVCSRVSYDGNRIVVLHLLKRIKSMILLTENSLHFFSLRSPFFSTHGSFHSLPHTHKEKQGNMCFNNILSQGAVVSQQPQSKAVFSGVCKCCCLWLYLFRDSLKVNSQSKRKPSFNLFF